MSRKEDTENAVSRMHLVYPRWRRPSVSGYALLLVKNSDFSGFYVKSRTRCRSGRVRVPPPPLVFPHVSVSAVFTSCFPIGEFARPRPTKRRLTSFLTSPPKRGVGQLSCLKNSFLREKQRDYFEEGPKVLELGLRKKFFGENLSWRFSTPNKALWIKCWKQFCLEGY